MSEAQQEAGSYRFEVTMAADGVELTGTGEAIVGSSADEQAMAMTMAMPEGMGEYEMRVVDAKVYLSTGMFGMPGDGQWIVIDPESDDPFSQMFGDMTGDMLAGADMQGQFSEYSDLISVEEVGSTTVDGVETTEYEITTDVEAAVEMMGIDAELAVDIPSDEITMSLWVDRDALGRRLRSDLGGQGAMEMRFFDHGADVTVDSPPADQVTDFLSFFEELAGQELSEEDLAEMAELFGGN